MTVTLSAEVLVITRLELIRGTWFFNKMDNFELEQNRYNHVSLACLEPKTMGANARKSSVTYEIQNTPIR
jgi:hypothetical protein